MADVNIYTAKRLGIWLFPLEKLAKSCEEESGKDRTLTKEDGLAAVNAAALLVCGSCEKCGIYRTAYRKTAIFCTI